MRPVALAPPAPAIGAVLAVALGVALSGCGGGTTQPAQTVAAEAGARASTATTPAPPPTATVPPGTSGGDGVPPAAIKTGPHARLTVHVKRTTALRATPGGRVIARIAPRTSFHSPTVLAVVARRGEWFAVLSPLLPDGRVGWISARASLDGYANAFSVTASLRRREVVVRRDGRVLTRFPVAIGRPANPTPPGRYAVTDKLRTEDPASPYGCCILALTGHQLNTPQDWGGGDRLAIHATDNPGSIGSAASLGCLRAPEVTMRRLVGLVPLGTIVTISA
jgi:lipoprotein-anchoring transpeptidase ErfK/SrfK